MARPSTFPAAAWAAVVAVGALGCRGEPETSPAQPLSSLRQAVVGGTPDPGDPMVVALLARQTRCEKENFNLLCSGTLIAPRVVLTAAHCLNIFGLNGQYEVFFGSRAGATDGQYAQVAVARPHPLYDPQSHEYDLALLRLTVPAPVEPQPLPGAPLPVSEGQGVRVVGFGNSIPEDTSPGEKRQGEMTVALVATTGMRSTPAPGMSCSGDSGGPVFATVDGLEQLFAVTVSGDLGCQTYAFNARADTALDDFIRPFLTETDQTPPGDSEGAAPCPALQPNGCATSGTEPLGTGLAWLGLTALGWKRRRGRS